ncbi:MAG: alpha/beta hydrolase [Clostridia bacterium]|nr:alpha/beta hydrolase [Clostridia bacterium]
MDIKLWEKEIPYFTEGADTPNMMHTYLIEAEKPLPCIVVLPGGGYGARAFHEGEPIAQHFNKRGMHAVVVDYRVAPNRYPAPLADAQRAIKIIRANADAWKVDPEKIVTLGFSAGGHLCASTLVLEDVSNAGHTPDEIDAQPALPNGGILCYPVISVEDDFGHVGSGKNLLGEKYKYEKNYFSLQNHVTDKTPKAFLWHTSDDAGVNVKNSLTFAARMRDCGIPFEMHIYPHGRHGLGLAEQHDDVKQWADQAADWVWRNI